jgi:hypothetical protein
MLEQPSASRTFDSERVENVYRLWLGSWETALKAVATAAQARTLSMTAATGHKHAVAVERRLVTRQFVLLAARGLPGERTATGEQ